MSSVGDTGIVYALEYENIIADAVSILPGTVVENKLEFSMAYSF